MGLDFEKPAPYTLSANELRQYGECPRKRYYASRDCLAVRIKTTNKNLELGKAIHSFLQYYYTELGKLYEERTTGQGILTPLTFDEVEELMEIIPAFELRDMEGNPAPLSIENEPLFKCMTACYIPQLIMDVIDYEVLSCELTFNINKWPIEDTMYHGFIDMEVKRRKDGKVFFFEHKTCKNFRPEIYSRFDIQLHLYNEYGCQKYGSEFGGMILNQIKKAKTSVGYDAHRDVYEYSEAERNMFFKWIKRKTQALVDPENQHEPCNNFMGCKMCEYANVCLAFGYELPTQTSQITENERFVDENGEPLFVYDPRDSKDEGE